MRKAFVASQQDFRGTGRLLVSQRMLSTNKLFDNSRVVPPLVQIQQLQTNSRNHAL